MTYSLMVQDSSLNTIVDLASGSATGIKTIWFDPGSPEVSEDWFLSKDDTTGGVLAKAVDFRRRAGVELAIPPQANMDTLITVVESVRDAFFTTGNLLRVVRDTGSRIDRYKLFSSRIDPPYRDEAGHRAMIVYKQITRWSFSFWMAPTAVGVARYTVL